MRKTILENDLFELVQTNKNKYEIVSKSDKKLVLGMEGNYTEDKLQEQLNNCGKNYVII